MLELINKVTEETYREIGVEGYDLTYTVKTKGTNIEALGCSGFKKNSEGVASGYVAFTYTPSSEYPSMNGNSGLIPEALQTHVKDTFADIKTKVAAGEPIVA